MPRFTDEGLRSYLALVEQRMCEAVQQGDGEMVEQLASTWQKLRIAIVCRMLPGPMTLAIVKYVLVQLRLELEPRLRNCLRVAPTSQFGARGY